MPFSIFYRYQLWRSYFAHRDPDNRARLSGYRRCTRGGSRGWIALVVGRESVLEAELEVASIAFYRHQFMHAAPFCVATAVPLPFRFYGFASCFDVLRNLLIHVFPFKHRYWFRTERTDIRPLILYESRCLAFVRGVFPMLVAEDVLARRARKGKKVQLFAVQQRTLLSEIGELHLFGLMLYGPAETESYLYLLPAKRKTNAA